MSIISTKILYAVVMLLVALLAYGTDRSGKRSQWYAIAIVIILSLLVGLRGETVGVDTWTYKSIFEYNNGQVSAVYGVTEPVFLYISSVIMSLSGETWLAFLFWAFVTNGLIVSRLYQLRERLSFITAIFLYMLVYYFPSMNIMRQMVAVALVFYGTKWLEGHQRIWKFMIVTVVALLIHYSAAICFLLLPLSLICRERQLSRAKKMLLWLMFFAVPLLVYGAYTLIIAQYEDFLNPGRAAVGIGTLIPIKLAILLFVFIWERNKASRDEGDYGHEYKMVQLAYLIGLLGFFISYFWRYADRMVYYFAIFETVCYGVWMRKHRRNDLIKLMLLFVMALYFLTLVILAGEGSGQGQYPYTLFWMN